MNHEGSEGALRDAAAGKAPALAGSGIFITVEDRVAGTSETREIPANDYNLVCVGSCYVSHTQASANGTHVLTIKGRRPTAHLSAPERSEAP